MDSPEISKIKATTTSSSDSPLVQDSPVFSYINNLSPIKPVKATHGAQGFPGLNSPPLVFTSPHLKSHREASFLKRPQDPHLSSAEKPKTQDEAQKFGNGPVASKKHITQLHMGLITDTQDCEAKTCVESQPCSSSEGVDEYLADPMEVDCASPAQSVNLCLNKSDNVPGTIIGSNEVTVFDNKRDTGTDSRIETEAPLITSEQAKEDLERKQSFDVKPVRIKLQSDGELPSDKCPNIESGVSVDNAFKRDYHHGQDIGGGHRDDCDYTPQSPPGRLQSVQVYENCAENVDSISKGMIGNMILHAPKARSDRMHRRCLQFEESPPCAIGKQDSYSSPIGKVNNSKPPAGTAESKMVKLSYADLKATSKRQMTTSLPPRYGGNSPLTGSKPSGIGLHLNSIVNAAPVVRGATRSIKLADHYIGVQVMNSASVKSCHLPENPRCLPVSLNVVEKDSDGPEDRNEAETSVAASSAITQSPGTVEFHCNGPPHEKRKFGSQDVESYKECNQSSPKKKRTRTSSSKDSDGCKRCNCKKTKCLKLYCDCFAAGVYCDEPCACQGCFNKPDYEDTVLETRKHIESRNPLAFAPKIVLREEEIQSTPSSARHKRGCNCKKSMCLKKYCECYQANVGCSNGCRCEGCKNVYGRKGDYIPIEHGATKDSNSDKASRERIESTFDEKLEMVATNKDILSAELYDSHNLIPLTPSLQGSGHANNLPPSSCLPTSYLLSPEPDLTIITSNEKSTRSSIGNSESNDILLETSKELTDMGSYDWRLDYESTGMADTFSPRFDAAPTTCRITPVSDLPSVDMASSTSSKTGDWTNASQLQLCPGSQGLSSGSSLHWRTSPVTPITRLGEGTKSFQGPDVENGLNDILQDDTPEILKDNSTSSRLVKVSSPNKKRVSPPHSHNQEVGASSSGALRSGRKFILKAVPSFPPLTPCINSKGSSITSQYTSNPQEKGRKK